MSSIRTAALAAGAALGDAIVLLLRLAALLLGPTRMGRLVASVSVPRYREHRLRTSLTVLGVALGVAVLVAVVLVNRAIVGSVTATFDDIGGKAELSVTSGGSGFDEALLERIAAVPGVARTAPVLEQTTLVRVGDAPAERILLLGVEMLGDEDESFRTYRSQDLDAIKADPIPFLNSRSNLLVPRAFARRYGLKTKDTVLLATPRGNEPFTVWGILDDTGVAKAFGGFVAIMYYPAMQAAFARGDHLDRVDVAVAEGASVAEVSQRLATALGPGLSVERPERKGDRTLKMLDAMRTGLTMGSLIALLVGMFLIYNTMSIGVVQRRRELGILRALGILRGQVLALVTLEGALLGGVGAVLGVGLGVVLARGLLAHVGRTVSELYLQVAATGVEVGPGLVVLGLALGLVGSVLSSLVPAREAMRVQPVETLRTGAFVPAAPRRRRVGSADVLALALFGVAALLPRVPVVAGVPVGGYLSGLALLFGTALLTPRAVAVVHALVTPGLARVIGVEARLASDNLQRDLGRASVTTGALMVGVAMTVSIAIFLGSFVHSAMSWVDQTIPADLHITSGSRFSGVRSVAMEDRLSGELSALPGVADLEHIRIVDLDFRGLPVKLLSTDARVFVKHAHLMLLDGDEAAVNADYLAGGVLVSENLARRFGLRRGDTVELPARGARVPLRVAGVMIDYTSDQGTLSIDRELYTRLYDDRRVDTYKLYLTPGTDAEAVRRVISERWGERYNLFVLTYREFKAGIVSLLDQVFGIMHALELVAIVIAVLGVVNALLASVLDRVREIGVLRAIGMRRRQVRLMVMVEGGLVGLCAVLLGLGAGLVLGQLLLAVVNLAQSGWYFPYHPPWLEIAQSCAVVVAVAVVAGWYPARAAARLVVTEALEYE